MADILDEIIDRLKRRNDRTERNFGLGATDGALRLISSYYDHYLNLITEQLEATKGTQFKGRKRELRSVDVEELTLNTLMAAITAIGTVSREEGTAYTLRTIGVSLERLCYAHALRVWDNEKAAWWEELAKRSAGSLAYRQRMLKVFAREANFRYAEWTDSDHINAGGWILDLLLKGPLFALDDEGDLTLTQEALDNLDDIMATLVLEGAWARPQTIKPRPWDSGQTYIEDIPHPLIKTYQKAVRRHVDRAIKAGTMQPTLDALNHAQGTVWRVNEPIKELVRQCYELDLGIPGLPRKHNLALPAPLADGATEDQVALWKKEVRELKTANRGFVGERIILSRDLAMADRLTSQPFWTHMNLDYRGRVYGLPHFNFQREDHVRAMFQFDQGQVLNAEGLYWLKVHLANTGAFDKIDKAPFDDRVAWVDLNWQNLSRTAEHPLDMVEFWSEADSPFMFVAACKALADAKAGHPCHLPVSFDGSCSGLQHLCAMTRAPEGSLVNLTPSDRPQDVYQVVAEKVKQRVEDDLGSEYDTLARRSLTYGVNRSLVKRNVMTYSYSSRRFGMTNQLKEDTMKPLRFEVMAGQRGEHPFGEDPAEQNLAARYLAGHTYLAIEETVSKPAEAMRFLQSIARRYAHEGKPVTWTTPLGFPVMLRYPKMETRRVQVFLHDKGIKRVVNPTSSYETVGINKRRAANAVAPGFVHSLDACHLMMVVLACKEEGIDSIALVHDSFGCLPNDAPKFRELILRTFRELYEKHDVLEDFRREAVDNLDTTRYTLPAAPEKGDLDLGEIENAVFAFA